jgi:hypothetical protein
VPSATHLSRVRKYVDVRAKSSTSACVALFCKLSCVIFKATYQFHVILNTFRKLYVFFWVIS